jgi:large subunit ribosomal protein L35
MRIAAQRTQATGAARGERARSASIADPMPKMKTHSGAKKRFKKTASGKLRGRRAFSSHILEKKSPKRKRRMAKPVEISPNDAKKVRTLLGGGK